MFYEWWVNDQYWLIMVASWRLMVNIGGKSLIMGYSWEIQLLMNHSCGTRNDGLVILILTNNYWISLHLIMVPLYY